MSSTIAPSSVEQAFWAAASQAMGARSGAQALDELGWWDLLAHLDDPEARAGAFLLFRAQGTRLASSPAVGALVAQPYLEEAGVAPGQAVALLPRTSARRGEVLIAVGDPGERVLLVDQPGQGVALVPPGDATLRPLPVPGRLVLHQVEVDPAAGTPILDEPRARMARARAAALGRTALAFEIVGAAEAAVAMAIEHAKTREQFGQRIGRFQAVRHLLALARTDCIAVETLARQLVALDGDAPTRSAEILKALAGRNGRRACERALQVLGGVGFTEEHDHHHCHQRVLLLDTLFGSSAQLTVELGEWFRTLGTETGYAGAMLTRSA